MKDRSIKSKLEREYEREKNREESGACNFLRGEFNITLIIDSYFHLLLRCVALILSLIDTPVGLRFIF